MPFMAYMACVALPFPSTVPTTPIKEKSPAMSLRVSFVGSNLVALRSSTDCLYAARSGKASSAFFSPS